MSSESHFLLKLVHTDILLPHTQDSYIIGCMLHVVVMEYIPCGELFALWKKLHNFSDSLVQLYVAELGMVLGLCLCSVISAIRFLYFHRHITFEVHNLPLLLWMQKSCISMDGWMVRWSVVTNLTWNSEDVLVSYCRTCPFMSEYEACGDL